MSSRRRRSAPKQARRQDSAKPITASSPAASNPESGLETLRRFIEAKRTNIFWVIAWTAFASCVYSQIGFVKQLMPSLIAFERSSNEFHSDDREGQKVELLYANLDSALGSWQTILSEYNRTFADASEKHPYTMDELTSGLQSVRKSKLEFERALASINGTQLHTHELEVYRLGFQDDLNRINGFAGDIAAIFSTAIQGEVSGHVKAVDALRNAPIKSTGVTLQERVREFSADAKSLQDGWLISVREGRLGQMAFSLSGLWNFVILPPLQLAFLVFAWRSLRKFKPAPAR